MERMRRATAYEPFRDSRQAKEHTGRWKAIGECLGNLKRLE